MWKERGGGRVVRSTGRGLKRGYEATIAGLDRYVFPAIVRYAVHPYVILGTILLLYPLIAYSNDTALALVLGNYTNVVSASVSSIVLMQSMEQHKVTTGLHHAHAHAIGSLHDRVDTLEAKLDQVLALVAPAPSSPQSIPSLPARPPRQRKKATAAHADSSPQSHNHN